MGLDVLFWRVTGTALGTVQTGRKTRRLLYHQGVPASSWRNTRRQAPAMPPRRNNTVPITGPAKAPRAIFHTKVSVDRTGQQT